jgi:hypothetical protein
MLTGEIPSPVRAIDEPPDQVMLREITAGHFVAGASDSEEYRPQEPALQ